MSIIRNMRERIESLEERECSCSSWADAAPWVAFWIALGVALSAANFSHAWKTPDPIAPDPSVECIKAGGEWSWRACRKTTK